MEKKLQLLYPSKEYLKSYVEAIQEYEDNHVDTYDFYNPAEHNIFTIFENFRLGKNLPKNYVKATYLWLVFDKWFIGEISIRHELTDGLLRFGGNIGYGIRYSEWGKGYGTYMLKEALKYAKTLGLKKVLITCNDDNVGSQKVIEKNGGVLWDKINNEIDGKPIITRRYWIDPII